MLDLLMGRQFEEVELAYQRERCMRLRLEERLK